MVTELGSLLIVSKSIVTAYGTDISSDFEYRFPIDPEESSTQTYMSFSDKTSAEKIKK